MEKRIRKNGFTLVEVLMALMVFSVFIVVFMSSQGYNITSSTRMNEDLILHNLAENTINEAILNVPKLDDSQEEKSEEKTFEESEWSNYSYKITYKKIEMPDFSKILEREDEDATYKEDNDSSGVQKAIFQKIKTNFEKMLWQVEVVITNKENKANYTLSTWIRNKDAKPDLDINL